MSLLYKEDVTYSVEVIQDNGNIHLLFTCDGGKFGTDEILDEYNLTPLELLKILQKI